MKLADSEPAMMLTLSVRTCCSERCQPSASTVCTISASRSCSPSSAEWSARRAPLRDQLVERGRELGERPGDALAALGVAVRGPGAVQQLVAPVHHLIVLLVRDPELVRGDRSGQRDRQLRHEIAAARVAQRAEPAADARARPRLGSLGRRGREALQQQAADARVQRRVDLAEEALVVGHRDARRAHVTDRRERLRIAEALGGVVVLRGEHQVGRRTAHRALVAQSREERPVLRLRLIHDVERQVVVGHRVLPVLRRRVGGYWRRSESRRSISM